ncbi:hypothetical protein COB55_02770 [Candidatus Wolfebacteria bacterium]|nr:MAG: hypothetical protein COB55_02770 [Candidatus Wolfebacteria bacterium]
MIAFLELCEEKTEKVYRPCNGGAPCRGEQTQNSLILRAVFGGVVPRLLTMVGYCDSVVIVFDSGIYDRNTQPKGLPLKTTTEQKLLELFSSKDDALVLTLIEKGLLNDLLSSDLSKIDREKFTIALGLEKETPKVQTHNFNIRNLTPNNDIVEDEMAGMFGEVKIVNWWTEEPTHFEGHVVNAGMRPQCITPVTVEYTQK